MHLLAFFRVSEVNRFLLDYEYAPVSEASLKVRHMPEYEWLRLSARMREVWPRIELASGSGPRIEHCDVTEIVTNTVFTGSKDKK